MLKSVLGKENEVRWQRALKPDAQAFDKIEIITVPRYKESELSGDEWRISTAVVFYRKGVEIHRQSAGDIPSATKYLAWFHDQALWDGKGFFAGEGDACDQEGCAETATVWLKKIHAYERDGHKRDIDPGRPEYRGFCERHKCRGDCGLDDADVNYVRLPKKPE